MAYKPALCRASRQKSISDNTINAKGINACEVKQQFIQTMRRSDNFSGLERFLYCEFHHNLYIPSHH